VVSGLLLADRLFFLLLHDVSGDRLLSERAMGIALAGGLLAELQVGGHVRVGGGQVRPGHGRRPPVESATGWVYGQLVTAPDVTAVREWLRYLGGCSYQLVGQRLLAQGAVVSHGRRPVLSWLGIGGRGRTYLPVEVRTAVGPLLALRAELTELCARRQDSIPLDDAVLLGLLNAVGLSAHLLRGLPDVAATFTAKAIDHLPNELRALIADVETAIGDAVLSHRL
jgi:hypothetical protein